MVRAQESISSLNPRTKLVDSANEARQDKLRTHHGANGYNLNYEAPKRLLQWRSDTPMCLKFNPAVGTFVRRVVRLWPLIFVACSTDPVIPDVLPPDAFMIANFSPHALTLRVASQSRDSAVVSKASAAMWVRTQWRVDRVIVGRDTIREGEELFVDLADTTTIRVKWVGIAGTTREGVSIDEL